MAISAFPLVQEKIPRKPPAFEQLNWIWGRYDIIPEQLQLGLPVPDEVQAALRYEKSQSIPPREGD